MEPVALLRCWDVVGLAVVAVLSSFGILDVLEVLAALGSLGSLGIRYCDVVDCFDVCCCAQVSHAGCEAFGSGEEEVLGEGFVGFGGVGGGLLAFLGGEARGFGEGDEPCLERERG